MRTTADRSIEDEHGKVVFYSAERFLEEIVNGGNCFICGSSPGSVVFNAEHVIPDWIVQRYDLNDSSMTLPGGTSIDYTRYKVPCCKNCNDLMNITFEGPLSRLTTGGYSAVKDYLSKGGREKIFSWLSLIFLKTHLKDRERRINPDKRVESARISELTDWGEMHHIHCLARSFYNSAKISDRAFGSLFVMRAKTGMPLGDYDYADYFPGRAILLRLGDVAFISVLNDSGIVAAMLANTITGITGPLSAFQCRELLARAAYANMLIENRPTFHTDPRGDSLTIDAVLKQAPRHRPCVPEDFGKVYEAMLATLIQDTPLPNKEEIKEHVRNGRWSFLFDPQGRFLTRAV